MSTEEVDENFKPYSLSCVSSAAQAKTIRI
ncbi:hypothetical protein PC110_g9907 [Phytophthora cactorum]|uniref:Uncharacterized protein n=1 Tax=Phytophthora cactorum TaxID=29920 RepID=A0A329SAQ6_9STRA|nr:hypothetical protein PC111_g381 [Phytophthora cactorum]KAG2860323.1 hypothetical protein PC113_g8159 [Phytophthora cactorum]RAW33761.1 hypothetical protein PC110_g9907 [Phytophthora cactorum]